MFILGCNCKHSLVRLFDAPSLLSDLLSVRRKHRSWRFVFYKHSRVFASVVTDSGILSCCDTSSNLGNLGIDIHVNKIQSCFAAPASGSGTLRTGYSVCFVDSLSLCAWDKLLKIFRLAASERKYFSGTSLIKTSDNVQPSSLLGDSEVFAVKHHPFEMIRPLTSA